MTDLCYYLLVAVHVDINAVQKRKLNKVEIRIDICLKYVNRNSKNAFELQLYNSQNFEYAITGLDNVLLPTLYYVSAIHKNIKVDPESSVRLLHDIVDNHKQKMLFGVATTESGPRILFIVVDKINMRNAGSRTSILLSSILVPCPEPIFT